MINQFNSTDLIDLFPIHAAPHPEQRLSICLTELSDIL